MIWLDVTKSGAARHRSGLTRVTLKLKEALGVAAREHAWGQGAPGAAGDWYVTAEVFAPAERAGFEEFLAMPGVRKGAIFHDAIPLKLPHVTWPQAVARHPAYMSALARFDKVWAVSEASRAELLGYWRWQGKAIVPPVEVLHNGADSLAGGERGRPPVNESASASVPAPFLLCVGIIEPRKNQAFLVEVAEGLWLEGLEFELRFVGRVNPHFGEPVLARIQRAGPRCDYEGPVEDSRLAQLYAEAAACLFPSIAEGCGLPLLEALWFGTPCLCSDLPALRENAAGGGCLVLPVNDAPAWAAAIRRVAAGGADLQSLAAAARARRPSLQTWNRAAATLARALGSP